jgi:uncharacterized protein
VGHRRDAGAGQRSAGVTAGQSGDLRAHWHTAEYQHYPIEGEGNMMNIDFPFHFDNRGHTAAAGDDDHIRDMIEQFLFTNAGERVNRPNFGSGLLQMVFAPNSPELAAALQFTIQAGLQQWLGDLIEVQRLEVTSDDAELRVELQYLVRRTRQMQTAVFTRSAVV